MICLIIRGEKCLKKVFLLYLLKRFVFPSKEKEKKNYMGGWRGVKEGRMDHMAGSRPEILKMSSTRANFFFIKVLHPSLCTMKRFHLWETMLEEIQGLCKSNSAFPFMTCNRKHHLSPSSLKECQGHRLQKKCPSPYYTGKKKIIKTCDFNMSSP